MTGSTAVDAERAFTHVSRARRRAALLRRLGRGRRADARLKVYDELAISRGAWTAQRGVRAIPVCAIAGTIEPGRVRLFDARFRPSAAARTRWQRVWIAEHRGTNLPPIDVIAVGDRYVVRDGHHRVSVAIARGAVAIDAVVAA